MADRQEEVVNATDEHVEETQLNLDRPTIEELNLHNGGGVALNTPFRLRNGQELIADHLRQGLQVSSTHESGFSTVSSVEHFRAQCVKFVSVEQGEDQTMHDRQDGHHFRCTAHQSVSTIMLGNPFLQSFKAGTFGRESILLQTFDERSSTSAHAVDSDLENADRMENRDFFNASRWNDEHFAALHEMRTVLSDAGLRVPWDFGLHLQLAENVQQTTFEAEMEHVRAAVARVVGNNAVASQPTTDLANRPEQADNDPNRSSEAGSSLASNALRVWVIPITEQTQDEDVIRITLNNDGMAILGNGIVLRCRQME